MNPPQQGTTPTSATPCHKRSAFTLIELMVVIAIIAILVGLTAAIGSAVINSGKKQATKGIIQTLDQALAAYIDQKGDIPPALVEVPYAELPSTIQQSMPGVGKSAFYPAIDGRGAESSAVFNDFNMVNSVALFIESTSVVPQVQEIINSINPKFIHNFSADEAIQPFLLTAFDAWGNPIRYVHPKFDGIIERDQRTLGDAGEPVNIVNPNKPFFVRTAIPAEISRVRMKFVRRNRLIKADFTGAAGSQGGSNQQQLSDFSLQPDSDGGLTAGNRPYFYSAGPDGDPSTTKDNIYTITPQLADPGIN